MGKIKSVSLSEAKAKLTQLVKEISEEDEPYLICSGSQIKAVLMGIKQYNDLVERVEDLAASVAMLQSELDEKPVETFGRPFVMPEPETEKEN